MNIYIIYFIGAIACFLLSFLIVKYYNNGKGNMHSFLKVTALIVAIVFFAGAIFLVNLSAEHYWKECLLDVFNNLTCIIRKTKCYRFIKRNVLKRKTKRLRYRCPPEPYSNSVRTDFFSYSNAIILGNQQINTSI